LLEEGISQWPSGGRFVVGSHFGAGLIVAEFLGRVNESEGDEEGGRMKMMKSFFQGSRLLLASDLFSQL